MSSNTPATYEFSEQIGHLLRRAYERHIAIFKEMVPDTHLTAAQFVVLCTVRDHPGCDVAAVIEATAVDEATARGIIERLKWRKFLSVDHVSGDTRHLILNLTPEGAKVIDETIPFARRISERTVEELDADERATVVRLLRKIAGMARP